MKSIYIREIPGVFRPAIADVSLDEGSGEYVIHRINVPPERNARGQGHGSALLSEIIHDADREGKTLRLIVFASDGLDSRALVAWYNRHGFRQCPDGWLRRASSTMAAGENTSAASPSLAEGLLLVRDGEIRPEGRFL